MHDHEGEPPDPEVPDELREWFETPPSEASRGFWILKDGRLKPVDLMTWAAWLESPDRDIGIRLQARRCGVQMKCAEHARIPVRLQSARAPQRGNIRRRRRCQSE